MRNHIVSKYPKYTFEDASSTALLILDGKVSDIDEISVVGRKQFSKLTFYSGNKLTPYKKIHGDAAKNGVFEIETKNHLAKLWLADIIEADGSHKLSQMVNSRGFDYSRLMIVFNGREMSTEFFNDHKIDVNSISKMSLESFGGIYGGMLTIESGSVSLINKGNNNSAATSTAVAAVAVATPTKKATQSAPPKVIQTVSTGFEVRKSTTTPKAIATTVAATVAVAEVAKPKEKVIDNNVYPFLAVEVQAEYPGCESIADKNEKHLCFQKSMMKHVRKNFKYPTNAQENGVQGRVYVKFTIGKDGKVKDVTILRGVSKDLDKEAIRIVSKLPKLTPASQDGQNVQVTTMLPIMFRLQ
jgi:TonB family protein